jgi:hypothetical protein
VDALDVEQVIRAMPFEFAAPVNGADSVEHQLRVTVEEV